MGYLFDCREITPYEEYKICMDEESQRNLYGMYPGSTEERTHILFIKTLRGMVVKAILVSIREAIEYAKKYATKNQTFYSYVSPGFRNRTAGKMHERVQLKPWQIESIGKVIWDETKCR